MTIRMSRSARYALAVALIGVATMVRMLLSPLIGSLFPFATYYVGILIAICLCGTAPSIMATLLGYIGAEYFFYGRSAIDADPLGVLMYFGVTLTIIGVGRSLLHAKRRAHASAAELKRHQREREEEIVRRKRVELELEAVKQALRSYGSMLEKQVAKRAEKLTDRLNLDPLQN